MYGGNFQEKRKLNWVWWGGCNWSVPGERESGWGSLLLIISENIFGEG